MNFRTSRAASVASRGTPHPVATLAGDDVNQKTTVDKNTGDAIIALADIAKRGPRVRSAS
jgi:hypothetical protein